MVSFGEGDMTAMWVIGCGRFLAGSHTVPVHGEPVADCTPLAVGA